MTYRELRCLLQNMDKHLLDDEVTVSWARVNGTEYIRVASFDVIKSEDADTLCGDHMVLNVLECD